MSISAPRAESAHRPAGFRLTPRQIKKDSAACSTSVPSHQPACRLLCLERAREGGSGRRSSAPCRRPAHPGRTRRHCRIGGNSSMQAGGGAVDDDVELLRAIRSGGSPPRAPAPYRTNWLASAWTALVPSAVGHGQAGQFSSSSSSSRAPRRRRASSSTALAGNPACPGFPRCRAPGRRRRCCRRRVTPSRR